MRRTLLLGSAVILVLLTSVPAPAQEDIDLPSQIEPVPEDEVRGTFPITDGEYRGTTGMAGSFWLSQQGATVVWIGSSTGPLEFSVVNGDLSGIWSIDGTADISGRGLPFEMAGSNTWTMSGTVSGSHPYIMSGSGSGVTKISAAGQTVENANAIDMADTTWQGILQVCGQVIGNWDQAIEAAFEGGPLEYSLQTYFAVFSSNAESDFTTRVDDLIERATRLQQNLSVEEVLLSGSLAELLLEAERLLEEIDDQPEDCPPDPSFLRIITQVVGDIMNTFLGRWSAQTPDSLQMVALRRLVEVGLRAGAIGSGAADMGTSDFLQSKAEAVLQRQFDAVVGAEPLDLFDVAQVGATAVMIDYTFDTGITGSDICLVVETC